MLKGRSFAWGAKGHEFESHYSDQENHRSRTMVFFFAKNSRDIEIAVFERSHLHDRGKSLRS